MEKGRKTPPGGFTLSESEIAEMEREERLKNSTIHVFYTKVDGENRFLWEGTGSLMRSLKEFEELSPEFKGDIYTPVNGVEIKLDFDF